MLQINQEPEWAWRNLDSMEGKIATEGDLCVAFEMRQANGLDEALAETKARGAISAITNGDETGQEYGLESLDWASAIKAGDVPLFTGVGYMLYAVELAWICARNMRGVEIEGKPAEWTKPNVALVLRNRRVGAQPMQGMVRLGSTYADAFMSQALKTVRVARIEGKS